MTVKKYSTLKKISYTNIYTFVAMNIQVGQCTDEKTVNCGRKKPRK